MATSATYLSAGSDWDNRDAGDGMCVFFFDGSSEFFPGGIGSALGYTNYHGPLAYNGKTLGPSDSAADINGVMNAYVGVGFDVRGNFSNTTDGKLGLILSGTTIRTGTDTVSSDTIKGKRPNAIGVRLGEDSAYKLHSVSDNLSTFPVASAERFGKSPPIHLHQTVTNRDDIVFQSARVTLQNKGQRVVIEIKDNATGLYHPYHVADLDGGGFGSGSNPESVRVGLSFATSDAVTNCDIKNVNINSIIIPQSKFDTLLGPATANNFSIVYPNAAGGAAADFNSGD